VQQPLVGQGLLVIEASRSHSDTPHSVGLLWTSVSPAQRHLPDNTQHSQETHPCHRRDSNPSPSKRAAANAHLSPSVIGIGWIVDIKVKILYALLRTHADCLPLIYLVRAWIAREWRLWLLVRSPEVDLQRASRFWSLSLANWATFWTLRRSPSSSRDTGRHLLCWPLCGTRSVCVTAFPPYQLRTKEDPFSKTMRSVHILESGQVQVARNTKCNLPSLQPIGREKYEGRLENECTWRLM
jgi:hypothetical protein